MRCESTVYLNKIFSDSKVKSCPLLTDVTIDSTDFTQKLTFFDDCCDNRCCCTPATDADAALTYTVDCVQVSVTSIEISEASALTPANVSVNGIDVDSLTLMGNIYSAGTADLINQVSNQMCMCKGLDTAGYFLITGAGPWDVALTITVYGVAEGCGTSRRFKLVFTSRPGTTIAVPGTSTFAVSRLCLPCTTMGISPVINFSFGGKASILSPVITAPAATPCALTLTGSLVLEPTANVYVTRQTLFRTNADLVYTPCDNLIPVPKPPCSPCCKEDCHIHIGQQSDCSSGACNGGDCNDSSCYSGAPHDNWDCEDSGCGCGSEADFDNSDGSCGCGLSGCGCGCGSGDGCNSSNRSCGCGCGSGDDDRWVSESGCNSCGNRSDNCGCGTGCGCDDRWVSDSGCNSCGNRSDNCGCGTGCGCGCGSGDGCNYSNRSGGCGCGSGSNCGCKQEYLDDCQCDSGCGYGSDRNSACINDTVDESIFERSNNHRSYTDRTYQFNGCNGCSF